MSALSSKTFLSAVDTYVETPTKENHDTLVAAADEYRKLWIIGQASGTAACTQKFDLSRIMDDLQPTCA